METVPDRQSERPSTGFLTLRLAAFAIDLLPIAAAGFVLGFMLALIGSLVYFLKTGVWPDEGGDDDVWGVLGLLFIVGFPVVMVAYFSVLESGRRFTLGKGVFHLRVRHLDGSVIPVRAAVARAVLKVCSVSFCGLGLLTLPFTNPQQALHDIVVGTTVSRSDAPSS